MPATFEQEWLSGHARAAFPFKERPHGAPNPLPSNFIADIRLFLSGFSEVDVFLSQVVYVESTDSYTLSFATKSNSTVVLQGTIARINPDGSSRVFKKQSIAAGSKVALFTPGELWDQVSGDSTENYLWQDAAVETTQVIPGPQTLRRIFIDGETIPPEDEWPRNVTTKLVAGYNLQFGRGESRVPLAPNFDTDLSDVIDLNCGPGLGAGFPPVDNDAPLGYVARFNGVPVSDSGAVNLALEDCLRVFQPEDDDGEPVPNTLMMASDCVPCCPCGEYRKVSRAEGRRSAKVKDMCDEIAAILEDSAAAYNDAVDRINKKRPPMAIVRNVRVSGSHVIFTVSNVSSLPIYAYIAFDVISATVSPGAPSLAGGQSHVNPIDQSGFPQIYETIDLHRKTVLPPLPFDLTENPLAGFPGEKFAPDLAELLVAVGRRSAENAFGAIPAGGTVEVSINFPDVEAAINGVADPDTPAGANAVISVSLPARLPRFSFRAVAVYGSSHSFPCTAETFRVMVEPMQVDQDVINQKCRVRLDDKFTVTGLETGVTGTGSPEQRVTDQGDQVSTDDGNDFVFNP